ncbi:MAG: hypothetical protein WCE61_20690 [Candidatus Acidiferrum sp.]
MRLTPIPNTLTCSVLALALQYTRGEFFALPAPGAFRFWAWNQGKPRAQQINMPDQPSPDRYKTEMPEIPGVSGAGARRFSLNNPALRLVGGLLVVLLAVFLGAKWLLRAKHSEPPPAEPPPQIEVPSPAPDPQSILPHATEQDPNIATVSEMVQPWSSKQFFIRNGLTGKNVPALLIRLPSSSASQPNGYWALSMNAPYGDCQLEYVKVLSRLKSEYGYRAARHPMVGNPCSGTLYDPLKLTNLPGNVWVRGAIVQGSDLRPPLGIEVNIQGKNIQAIRME